MKLDDMKKMALPINPANPPVRRPVRVIELVTLPVHDSWNFNNFLDDQFKRIQASGANNWLIDFLMMGTIAKHNLIKEVIV